MMNWSQRLFGGIAELRANKRLRYGVLAIALVIAVEGGLRWIDWLDQQQTTLTRLQTDLSQLKSQLHDEAGLRQTLVQAQKMGMAVDARLWQVSSDAVGQARLKDWVTGIVKRALANQYAITLISSRELMASKAKVSDSTQPIWEFRTTLSFQLTPNALEAVLLEIEGGEPFASVETLSVKTRERRVEMTIKVLMRVIGSEHV